MSAHTDPVLPASRARTRRAAGALRRLFETRPAGLLTDVDGTISRITTHTNDATVSPLARRALTRLTGDLDLVAVVTGRAVERARRMVGVAGASYVGNHGLEWLDDGVVRTDPAAEAARPQLEAALAAVRAQIRARDLIVEDKRVSVAIHYRLAEQPEQVGRTMLEALRPFVQAGTLRLIEGGLVVNLLPTLAVDKGAAARRLVEQHGLRAVAFLGDDVTDLDAFRALHALRAEGTADTLVIGVGSPEGPPEVRAEADLVLEGVGEVERVLAALAARHRASTVDST
jgi:trehalose 6-phosphate phosphatase